MEHMGDITAISGYAVQPVDAVIGGSPCQDLSIAGKRAGLAGARSSLFMEQIRIIKEMRDADVRRGRTGKFIRPRFMVWENVPGAFSSNKGNDFRAVPEETIRVAELDAPDVPLPAKGKWPMADCWYGDGWSIAYRVLDAQFWGVPQRRRRIALVADFGGHAAPEILFVRQGLCWDIAEGGETREETAAGAGNSAAGTVTAVHLTQDPITGENIAPCLSAGNPTNGQASIGVMCAGFQHKAGARTRGIGYEAERAPTLTSEQLAAVYDARGSDDGTYPAIARSLTARHDGSPCIDRGPNIVVQRICVMSTGQARAEILDNLCPTLNCNHEQPIVSHSLRAKANCAYREDMETYPVTDGKVRRLTPLECERLQGYPDGWTDIGPWTDSAGKLHKESSDSARYKALGNSIALPPWSWVLRRLCACYERTATMASLFDGIGGFPLIWERLNGPGTCLWASEIEEFPMAVTRARFGSDRDGR